jgi:hypothetical protein
MFELDVILINVLARKVANADWTFILRDLGVSQFLGIPDAHVRIPGYFWPVAQKGEGIEDSELLRLQYLQYRCFGMVRSKTDKLRETLHSCVIFLEQLGHRGTSGAKKLFGNSGHPWTFSTQQSNMVMDHVGKTTHTKIVILSSLKVNDSFKEGTLPNIILLIPYDNDLSSHENQDVANMYLGYVPGKL